MQTIQTHDEPTADRHKSYEHSPDGTAIYDRYTYRPRWRESYGEGGQADDKHAYSRVVALSSTFNSGEQSLYLQVAIFAGEHFGEHPYPINYSGPIMLQTFSPTGNQTFRLSWSAAKELVKAIQAWETEHHQQEDDSQPDDNDDMTSDNIPF